MHRQYSQRSPAVKRLMKEAQELKDPTEQFYAQPLDDNLFEWHFTIRGPGDSDFNGGLYHGRIILPPEYPMKPPSIILLTSNGRFETNKKICLSISGYHPESWQPSWSIRTALLAIIGFMPTHGGGAIGSLDYTPQERKILAKKSQNFNCAHCGNISNVLLEVTEASKETDKEAKELASQIAFQAEKKTDANKSQPEATQDPPSPPAAENVTDPATTLTQAAPTFTPPWNMPPGMTFPFPPFVPPQYNQQNAQDGNQQPMVPRFPLPFIAPPFGQPMQPGMMPPWMAAPPHGMPVPPWMGPPHAAPPHTAPNVPTTPQSTPVTSPPTVSTAQSAQPSVSDTQTSTQQTAAQPTPQEGAAAGAANTTSDTQTTTTSTAPSVRQRLRPPEPEAARQPEPQAGRGAVGQNAELPRHHAQSGGTCSVILMTIIGFLLGFLVIRRIVYIEDWGIP